MKNVLVIYYSQSGQLKEIAQSISHPLIESDEVHVDFYKIELTADFPFPWTSDVFFNSFPETFQQIPSEIKSPPQHVLDTSYDLILFHYQVWYLTPSIPINSFLKSSYAHHILMNKPVITISGSRNMWAKAQDKVKVLLLDNEASLVGNIAMTDRHGNWISVITIVDWMFSGVKRKAYGFFPMPGVSTRDIDNASKFGDIILKYLKRDNYQGMQADLVKRGAVKYKFFLVSMDQKGNRMFTVWSKLILKNTTKRNFLVSAFKYYVIIAIYLISPIVFLLELLLFPLLYFIKIKKEKKHYLGL